MKCLICGRANWMVKFHYNKPDKYEKWQGIKDVKRSWLRCTHCGFYHQTRNYPLEKLEGIYRKGYRDKGFRGKDIGQAYDEIWKLPAEESENHIRFGWYVAHCGDIQVIDIGSGLGVWPLMIQTHNGSVTCVEENEDSLEFLSKSLGLKCLKSIDDTVCAWQCVSLVHVLEHIENPDAFLEKIKKLLFPDGARIFIEVPDASEFSYIDKDHDEFNSCHCYFYDMPSLYRLLERNGYTVKDMHRQHYKERGLTRLMVVAEIDL